MVVRVMSERSLQLVYVQRDAGYLSRAHPVTTDIHVIQARRRNGGQKVWLALLKNNMCVMKGVEVPGEVAYAQEHASKERPPRAEERAIMEASITSIHSIYADSARGLVGARNGPRCYSEQPCRSGRSCP